jgi:hypothetical protein
VAAGKEIWRISMAIADPEMPGVTGLPMLVADGAWPFETDDHLVILRDVENSSRIADYISAAMHFSHRSGNRTNQAKPRLGGRDASSA